MREETLVSSIVGEPTIVYSYYHMKNNAIVDERLKENDVKSSLIIRKSDIRDIAKYFNYPIKENEHDYRVSRLQNIGDPNERMGSNFSRHHNKGFTGRRTQSSGNLCDPQSDVNDVVKMSIPCSSKPEQRHSITGSLPNSLDNDKKTHGMNNLLYNTNVISNRLDNNIGGILSHAKSNEVEFHDKSTMGMELVKYHSYESLKGDPWKYQHNGEVDSLCYSHGYFKSHSQVEQREDDVSFRTGNNYYHGEIEKSVVAQDNKRLPTRRIDPKWCDPTSIRVLHKKVSIDTATGQQADSGLTINRQRKQPVNANSKRLIVGENYNQDQGYASERSPEDEHPPLLPEQSILNIDSPERTFRIILQKSSRGLGLSVSGGGTIGPVRVKRLFPQQPAALSNQLKPGDILLSANGVPLSGLTNYEALEVLRTTSSTVELLVCRQAGEANITPPGDPPTPPMRRKPLSENTQVLNAIPPLHIEPCGEFDIEMTKVSGSLGFTLRKVDSSVLGHYIRALVREPALSDGRIQPGDKIVAVDDTLLSPMTHEEAVSLLRQCGPKVKLRLYRDLAQTPVSALSPTEPDNPLRPPHTSLRYIFYVVFKLMVHSI
ncbi:hypothetical protein PV327_008756 [Microctonus hyperodae]|uniref:PDZ domain-containing protein n=1 Tax=Microctonus hyperodae TaxID=165561 RepID=A0AA39KV67_MICHY|nr:hypothetical protein PV327_008756 [Microctonus hyperodae]